MASAEAQTMDHKVVDVWNGELQVHFQVAGSGPPVVYLHPAAGPGPFDGFLTGLTEHRTVYAPAIPGTAPGDPHAIHKIDDLHDLVLIYEEAIRGLELSEPPVLVGQSFGGMLAAELAAHFPGIASRIVLLSPLGLWREEAPVADWMSTPPHDLPALLFADPGGPAASAMFTMPPDPQMAVEIQAGMVWAMGCTGKFVWPIPERGLRKRLHRIDVPALVLWGRRDRLNPVAYAEEWQERVADCTVEILDDAGHVIQVEDTERTLALVQDFLA